MPRAKSRPCFVNKVLPLIYHPSLFQAVCSSRVLAGGSQDGPKIQTYLQPVALRKAAAALLWKQLDSWLLLPRAAGVTWRGEVLSPHPFPSLCIPGIRGLLL